jgi:Domain of unknown function (DUF5753)/Helix-turn-helix domain
MNSHGYGPVVQRALLTRDLVKLRRERKETQQVAARALKWSLSKFIRVEGGDVRLSQADLEYLLRHYNVTDEEYIKYLSGLAEGGRKRGWWQDYKLPNDKAFADYIGFETDATSIQMSDGANIPGLLQTEPYMRALLPAYVEDEEIENIVELRKARQDRAASRPVEQVYILDEAAVRRKVGDAMPDQLRHLITLAEKPNVTILVIRFEAGPHFGMKGPFVILSFDFGLDDVLYLESARRGDLIIGPGGRALQGDPEDVAAARVDDVAVYREGFQRMTDIALDPAESAEFIQRLIGEML